VHRFGDVKYSSLKIICKELQTSKFFSKVRDKSNLKDNCRVCEYLEICGGCRTAAEVYTDDIFESDPKCGYILKVLRKK
jgi:radical SAM protein with 4Fe4S-binding SPASM domain